MESENVVVKITPLWFACEHPERPPDPYVLWHYAPTKDIWYRGGKVAAEALSRRYADDSHVTWLAGRVAGTATGDTTGEG